MICQNCNAQLNSEAIFCIQCGTKVEKVSSNGTNHRFITIGRNKDNNLCYENPKVSKYHARVEIKENKYFIEDLNSANGVFVNGVKTDYKEIKEGDNIKLASEITVNFSEIVSYAPHQSPVPIGQKNKKTIGRAPSNDIVIENVKASRFHAFIYEEAGDWYIEDNDSGNGTFVNGSKIKKKKISYSDIITIAGIPLKIDDLIENKQPVQGDVILSLENVSFSVGNKRIIDDISFTIQPGEFVGLIGPSGSGKTTLLMLMNGILNSGEGKILINNQSLRDNPESFRGVSGFVPQDDIIHRELTVKESLSYTSKLRMPGLTDTEVDSHVKNVLTSLDLVESKDVLIGNAEKKGISGGQRKRVNLGQELMTEPSILFLDEPTSGLDPKSDHDVMHLLKNIAAKGRIVILTTHAITAENFNILSHLIVLSKSGKLAYFGKASEATSYFGVSKPFEIFEKLNSEAPEYWKSKFRSSHLYPKFIESRKNEKSKIRNTGNSFSNKETGISQLFTLIQRFATVKLRDKVSSLILLLQAPIIAFFIALVFSKPEEKVSALFIMVVAAIWLGCSNSVREIVSEKSIFKREKMVNLSVNNYLLSKIIVLSVLSVIQCLILTLIVSNALDLNGNIVELFSLLFITSFAALSIGLLISSLVTTNEAAMGLIPLVLIPQIILGGLISKFRDMSDFIQVLAGFMLSRWSFETVMISEFENKPSVINSIGFNPDNLIIGIALILIIKFVFYFSTLKVLQRK